MERRGFTPVPLLLIALVLAIAVLLIAGYGVPVGVGLIVGFLVGGAIGTMGVVWLGAGPGRSIGAGGVTFSPSTTQAPVELPDWIHDGQRVAGIEMSPLRAVLAVGQIVEVAGLRIELTAVELRETGGIGFAVVHATPPDARAGGPLARVAVRDDVETVYAAAANPTGGGPLAIRHDIRFAPAPPASASRLTLRIEEFADPFPGGRRERLVGPWEFVVALGRPGE